MNRIAAIVLFVLGLVLVILGITKILPGAASGGGGLCLFGIIIFGLSFIPVTPSGASEEPPLSAGERLTAIFYEPARVFRNLRAYPQWLAPFIVIAVAAIAFQVAFTQRIGAETIAAATIEKVIDSGFIPADKIPDVRAQALQSALPVGGVLHVLDHFPNLIEWSVDLRRRAAGYIRHQSSS